MSLNVFSKKTHKGTQRSWPVCGGPDSRGSGRRPGDSQPDGGGQQVQDSGGDQHEHRVQQVTRGLHHRPDLQHNVTTLLFAQFSRHVIMLLQGHRLRGDRLQGVQDLPGGPRRVREGQQDRG